MGRIILSLEWSGVEWSGALVNLGGLGRSGGRLFSERVSGEDNWGVRSFGAGFLLLFFVGFCLFLEIVVTEGLVLAAGKFWELVLV